MQSHFRSKNSGTFKNHVVKWAFAFCLFSTIVGRGQTKMLLALSKTDHVLAVIDPVSLKVMARIPVGNDPHEVIASDDGKTAFVSIYGGGSLHELDVIDLVAQKSQLVFDTKPFLGPHGLSFAAGKAWFTAEGSKAVCSYDPASSTIDWVMGTGQERTHMIWVRQDGKKIYTTNVSSGTVSILSDTMIQSGQAGPPPNGQRPGGAGGAGNPPPPPRGPHDQWMHTVVETAKGSEGFDVSRDGGELWTASSDDGSITIIDTYQQKRAARIDAKVTGANRLKFTPDGRQVFITSLRTGELVVYDVKSRREVKRIATGHGAAGILMDPDGTRAFVACSADNYIAIIDLKSLTVTGRLEVGGVPDGMAWAIQTQ